MASPEHFWNPPRGGPAPQSGLWCLNRTPIATVMVKAGPTRILEGPIRAMIVVGKTRRFGGSLMGVVMNFVGLWSSCPTGAGS